MVLSKCLGNPSLCAHVAFRTAFLIACIKIMPMKADFRELSIPSYYLRERLSLGKSQSSQENFLGKQPLCRRFWHYSAGESLVSGNSPSLVIQDDFFLLANACVWFISRWGCSFPSLPVRQAWPWVPRPHWWILAPALWSRTSWAFFYLNGFHRVTKPINKGMRGQN